jgi:hypothetical protein
MSLEQTQQIINRYFDLMSHGGDFAECYSADVTWTTTDTGQQVRGASPVRDFIVALHNNMFDAKREGSSSPMGMHILRATVFRHPARPIAGSTTASHMTSSIIELQPCAATVRSAQCLASSLAICRQSQPQPTRYSRAGDPLLS